MVGGTKRELGEARSVAGKGHVGSERGLIGARYGLGAGNGWE